MRAGVFFPELTFEVMTFLTAGPCSPYVLTPPLSRNIFVVKHICAGAVSRMGPPKSDRVHPQPYKTPFYCCQIGPTSPKHVKTCMCEYSGANSGDYQGTGEKKLVSLLFALHTDPPLILPPRPPTHPIKLAQTLISLQWDPKLHF